MLFSKLRNKKPEPQKELIKAALTPATATMVADGSVSEVEIAQLANMCSFSPIFFGTESKTIMQTINEIIKDVNKNGLEQVVANAKQTLPPHLRETAVLFAMRIALADGSIDDGEKNILIGTGERFEIPQEQFMKMFDVVAMLQRGPTPPNV